MKYKRSYVIDKKFQYGKSIKIVGAVTLLIAAIILAVGVMIYINNNKTTKNNKIIVSNINSIKKILDLQQSIYIKFSLLPTGADEKTFSTAAMGLTSDINTSTKNLKELSIANEEIIKSNNKIITTNTYLILVVVIITLSGLGVLFFRLVRHTHRISGPIFVMTMHANAILKGEKPNMRNLRDDDEFIDFYNLFRKICERVMELENKEK